MPFSTRAASRHGGGDGESLLEWMPYDMPFTPSSEHMREMAKRMKGRRNPFLLLKTVMELFHRPCDILFSNATLLETLSAGRFDAVLTFSMPGDDDDSCSCLLSHYLRAPLITVYGIPFLTAPLDVPQFGSGLTEDDLQTLKGRAINLMHYVKSRALQAMLRLVSRRGVAPVRRRLGLPLGPAARGGTCRPVAQLFANSFHLEAPQPLGPPQVLIGPIGPRAGRPGPLDPPAAAAFLDGASDGAAVVSFGSVPLFGAMFLTKDDYVQLALAFADLAPVRVLWLLKRRNWPEGMTQEELPLGDNTLIVEWVDLNDAVDHPNVRLFVSHCGCHSTYEALYHGKPIVAVPFQFEQNINGQRLQALGFGEVSPEAPANRKKGQTYTRAGMRDLMAKVMTQPSYREAAARVSAAARMEAEYRPPLEMAAQEIELALTHMDYGRWRPYDASRKAAAGTTDSSQQEL